MEEIQFEMVIKENTRMIYSIINDVVYKDFVSDYQVSKDDLFQEGCIALYQAFLTYHSEYGAKFSTYAYMVIRRRVIHKFREYIKPLLFEKYSYDAVNESDYLSYYGKESAGLNKEKELCQMALDFKQTLDEPDLIIVELRQRKASYKEISLKTGLNEKQIDNRLCRVRRLYRSYLNKQKESLNDSF